MATKKETSYLKKLIVFRYLNIYVGMPDVEEGFNITKPISPHEVSRFDLLQARGACSHIIFFQ